VVTIPNIRSALITCVSLTLLGACAPTASDKKENLGTRSGEGESGEGEGARVNGEGEGAVQGEGEGEGKGEGEGEGEGAVTPATLSANRDRLLDTYASIHSEADRCAAWAGFDDVQKGVFLTISDLLGKRTFMGSTRLDTALDHVTKLYAVNGADPSPPIYDPCGGKEYNRMFYEVDAELLGMFRDVGTGIPAWRASHDLGGPHAPFDQSDETFTGQPRGQTQFFSTDAKAVTLERNGVEGVLDAHIVEHDIDYDLVHNSDPQCTYLTGFGRDLYQKLWTPLGNGGPEFDYLPSGCQ
jgi:hypothetical protein